MTLTKNHKKLIRDILIFGGCIVLLIGAGLFVWVATLTLPDLNNFESRKVANSTKIFDRTGKVLLYNIHQDIKRTEVASSEISEYIKQAHIAVEDAHFYSHSGIRPTSIMRAIIENILPGGSSSGGSTITQQVIKNSLLTRERALTRKIKEWILAVKLEQMLTKDQILTIYLNESPYGGTMYGVEEASRAYFNKSAFDVNLTEAAYLAAMPQRPSYFSPYGKNRAALEDRKNFVLRRMYDAGFITEAQMKESQNTQIEFQSITESSGKALHFVFYIREYLEEKYGIEALEQEGLQVITTLDYDLQKQFEEDLKTYVLASEPETKMSNASLVALDPKTGQILSLVGSRDYFDEKIDGKVNVALQGRQPGSAIKPVVYASLFEKGYTPETVVFDLPTEFNTYCDAQGNPGLGMNKSECYMPNNYDNEFRGPISFRHALAQSLNIPAVKALYLTGLNDAISLATQMGIRGLDDKNRLGLTLVLGGGEVSLLDLASAYGVFATEGIKHPTTGILKVTKKDGTTLEEYKDLSERVISENTARQISSILSDAQARVPAFALSSPLNYSNRDVAAKTGTTQNYGDVWTMGYTPSLVIGVWGGNNDNTPMIKKTSGYILAPLWRKSMDTALASSTETESFTPYIIASSTEEIKPVLQGIWCTQTNEGIAIVHEILHWVQKRTPLGPYPTNPETDSQYKNWEYPVQEWFKRNQNLCGNTIQPLPEIITDPLTL
ncbi:MAG: transglycosylase domain-containing protein [Minisyncoccia bacterium]